MVYRMAQWSRAGVNLHPAHHGACDDFSTTCCTTAEDTSKHPRDSSVTVNFTQLTPENDGKIAALRETVDRLAGTYNADMLRRRLREAEISGSLEEGILKWMCVWWTPDFGKLVTVHFVPLRITRMYGKTLAPGEGKRRPSG